MKSISNKLVVGAVVGFTVVGTASFAYFGGVEDFQKDVAVETEAVKKSEENTVEKVRFIKIKGCSSEVYEDGVGKNNNPNHFMCRSYLTDGEFVYYHGLRATPTPLPSLLIPTLIPSFIATSSPDTKDSDLMASTVIEGADPETFEVIYFDDSLPASQKNNTFSFARDKDYLYWEGKRFKGVDPNTFAILGRGFIKDKDSVYFKWEKLEGSHGETFEFLWSGFARDKNFVYRNNPEVEIFDGVDPATFEKIDDVYLKDKNAIYYRQEKIEGSDPATFEFLQGYTGKDMGKAYAKDKSGVYYLGKKIEGADPITFEFLPNAWSKDKNAVYGYGGKLIEGIDSTTFAFIGKGSQYIKDKNGVYYNNRNNSKKIEGADPETFEFLGGNYLKDKNFVWSVSYRHGGGVASLRKLDGAKPASFEVIERQYARDNTAVYCSGDVMEGFDWGSVVMLQNNYIRDKNSVFLGCKKIEGADAKSFKVFRYSYAKDKNSVYYLNKKIEGADVDSFENLTCSYSKDKNSVYKSVNKEPEMEILKLSEFDVDTFRVVGTCNTVDKSGVYKRTGEKIEGADPETFEFLGGSYGKDASRAYYSGVLIEGVDIESFKFTGGWYAKDKNKVYFKGEEYNSPNTVNGIRRVEDVMISPNRIPIHTPPPGAISDFPVPVPVYNIVPSPVYPIGL